MCGPRWPGTSHVSQAPLNTLSSCLNLLNAKYESPYLALDFVLFVCLFVSMGFCGVGAGGPAGGGCVCCWGCW